MNTQIETTRLVLNRIVHPSDFSPASEVAFAHALNLALIARAELRMMHVAADRDDMHWSDFPGVRATLARWGLLPEGSPKEAVEQLGLNIGKILWPRADPVTALLEYLDEHSPDLIVLATHQRAGLTRWLHRAVAEPVARRAGAMTLFLPQDVTGFIALDNGTVTLRHVLIPIDQVPHPQAAVHVAAGLAHTLACPEVSFTLVHVGATGEMPAVHVPYHVGWTWDRIVRHGDVLEQILDVDTACAADLMVLLTQGHQSFLDTLRGSTSERILRGARCPVLVVPAA